MGRPLRQEPHAGHPHRHHPRARRPSDFARRESHLGLRGRLRGQTHRRRDSHHGPAAQRHDSRFPGRRHQAADALRVDPHLQERLRQNRPRLHLSLRCLRRSPQRRLPSHVGERIVLGAGPGGRHQTRSQRGTRRPLQAEHLRQPPLHRFHQTLGLRQLREPDSRSRFTTTHAAERENESPANSENRCGRRACSRRRTPARRKIRRHAAHPGRGRRQAEIRQAGADRAAGEARRCAPQHENRTCHRDRRASANRRAAEQARAHRSHRQRPRRARCLLPPHRDGAGPALPGARFVFPQSGSCRRHARLPSASLARVPVGVPGRGEI